MNLFMLNGRIIVQKLIPLFTKCPHVQIAFLKFTSCDNQALVKIGQSSHKMYSNNILNLEECTTILNACTKKSGNLLKAPRFQMF